VKQLDLIIIGGGITGAGCLLEATKRGLRCLLLEKGDFSSGTTQASSRLIHGGIRYLEHFHFGLVAESLKERFWISRTFSHLLSPLAIHIPVYGWGKRSPFVAGLGVRLYDLLAGRMKIENSRIYFSKSAREMIPEISHDGLSGLFVFHDYQILMPERLVLENIHAAVRMGAHAENYTRVEEIKRTTDGYLVRARNRETGESTTYSASAVINAAGSWIDEIRKMAGFRGKLLRPTKGIHIEAEKLTDRALFVEAGTDRRLFFILPFLNHTLIGTTDTDYTGSPDEVRPLPEDISYLTDNVNRIFRGIKLDPSRIFSAYGGLRPLINVAGRKESAVPRRHRVVCEGSGKRFISITGGKLTTYRKMAEDTIRKTLRVLGKPHREKKGAVPFPCGETKPESREELTAHLKGEYGIGKETASALYVVYGAGAEKLLKFSGNDSRLKSPLSPHTHEIPAQILFGYESESACRLEDIILRRMLLGKSPTRGLEAEPVVKEILVKYLGKSREESDEIFESFRTSVADKFMINLRQIK
jgi:glycerol-3-phosphate dehydrogenase